MNRIEGASHSTCSSRPLGPNPKVKKRGIRRFSIRQFFYANSLMATHRRFTRNKSVPEVDARSESSLSMHTTSGDRDLASGLGGSSGSFVKDSVRHPVSQSSDTDSNSLSSHTLLKSGSVTRDDESLLVECPLCLTELMADCFPKLTSCSHRSCFDCLQQYLRIEITESRVNISCPECTEPLHPTDIRNILNDANIMCKYEDFMLRRVLATDPDTRWCPAPDCSFGVIAAGCASCPRIQCLRPGCQTFFCYHCKQEWHPNQTCDAARAQRSPNIRASSVSFGQDSTQRDDIKPCPRCQVLIVKMDDGSCNHMTCAICGAEFCWLCMKEISDLHYLSPSGCTFWGKKPWSRKKKILWQLGTLVGAPVGIGLVAGIAVPAIIIGVPVWVGRKLHTRYEHSSKHKRNLVITGGVTASILISPILASLAVGIGVPILLAYVYGVVPISLCRSGGCGVSTSGAGVRIEFDDENDMSNGGVGQTHDAQSVDTISHRVGNPSIGEVSFGMSASLSMGSGSHLDRIGVIRDSDRESASNTAIAGVSLNGSMVSGTSMVSSGMVSGTTGHRLEVQADVASNKRFSFSSETASATVSLSEKSTTLSYADDASTKALAGSIIGCRDTSSGFTPVEVHIDASVSAAEGSQDTFQGAGKIQSLSGGDSVHEASYSGGCTITREKRRPSSADKQAMSYMESESCSLWSRDDASSERVRFDEHVNFIDDLPSEEFHLSPNRGGSESPLETSHDSWPSVICKRKASSDTSDDSFKNRKHSLTWLASSVVGNSSSTSTSSSSSTLSERRTGSVSTWHGPMTEDGCGSHGGDSENVTFSPLYSGCANECCEYVKVFGSTTSAFKSATGLESSSDATCCLSHGNKTLSLDDRNFYN